MQNRPKIEPANDFITQTAAVLNKELDWFYRILDTRIKLHFGHECEYQDIFEIEPPKLETGNQILYNQFIEHYQINFAERVVLILALISHIKPQMLDVFFTKNATFDKEFTEFGGRTDRQGKTFSPTGETALFILAGTDLEKRFLFSYLFDAEHFFNKHNLITLESNQPQDPYLSRVLTLSNEALDLITRGHARKPAFSSEFPAKLIETQLEWDDLVLDPYTLDQVYEIKAWIDHGETLLSDTELARKIKPGYRSLFFGPSGTGKTLTASLLGKVTERDVYHIDLSLVISKYIGETEKNLEKVFKQAENKNWILFFDEADALFGKRTNVNDAHDRFANQEVSYLLQRMEDYAGVVILASNFKSNLDDAFTRRFQSIIHFPIPKHSERTKLWTSAFSSQFKLDENVDLDAVAGEYEMSGGSIINVVRYASLMTLVQQKNNIALHHIKEGIRKEFQKEGKTF
ncbi:ATP-binding protein [Aliikangiella coralliicola]|uniref:ATP-binding protein n=1 Tax=Aliikangiella coralliicola TaxID=2592383 RepID=A0A545UD83_9GAMM|nr:ATP-binding protein [Aliikangiella coralliicola]TQV87427.1 ATP-binding protein [Aliikangiella coralliicola]